MAVVFYIKNEIFIQPYSLKSEFLIFLPKSGGRVEEMQEKGGRDKMKRRRKRRGKRRGGWEKEEEEA